MMTRVPDDVVGVPMTMDGSGVMHCLAPCPSIFEGIEVHITLSGAVFHTAFFRPRKCGIPAGDPVQVIPRARGLH